MFNNLIKLFLFCLAFVFCTIQMTYAQALDTSWTKTYGLNDWNFGSCVQQTFDGGFIIAGQTQSITNGLEFWLLKTNAFGDTLWSKTYGGVDFDECLYVQQTSDSGYIITGVTRSFGAGDDDIWLLKTDALGDTLWSKTYGGSAKDNAHVVRQTTDSGYILTGGTRLFAVGYYDLWILKTDSFGDTLWTKTYGTTTYESGFDIQETTDGGYIVAAGTLTNFWLLKTDSFGDSLWTKTYGGGNEEPNSVVQTNDGGYMIVGRTQSFGAGASDIWLVKTDSFGDTLWTKTYGGTDYEDGRTVQQTPDGGYFITGKTQSFGAGGIDSWLLKTDSFGDTLWTKIMGGVLDDEALSGQQTTDGGYIITGYTESFGSNTRDLWLIKLEGINSLTIPPITAMPCDDECVALPVIADLSDAIEGFQVPLTFAPPLSVCSVSTAGLITDGWTTIFTDIDNTNGVVSVSMAQGAGLELPAGIDTLFYLYFYAPPQCNTETYYIWDTTYSGDPFKKLAFVDTSGAVILPSFIADTTTILGYIPGDFTNDNSVDIADLVAFVAFAFQDGPPPCIMNSIDVNGSGGSNADIGDIVYLVQFMFGSGSVPQCGAIGMLPIPKLTITNNSNISSTIEDGKTIITLSSDNNIFGLELYINGNNFSSVNTEFRNLDLLYRQDNNTIKIGLLDLDGSEFIPLGNNRIIELDGEFEILSAIVVDENLNSYSPLINSVAKGGLIPTEFSLAQNYPNPFNPTTSINFSLPEATAVKLEVYNIQGQKVTSLIDGYLEAGYHTINWDGRETASGVYLYRIDAGSFKETKKMLLLK